MLPESPLKIQQSLHSSLPHQCIPSTYSPFAYEHPDKLQQVSSREVLLLKFYDSDKFTGDDYLGMLEVQVDEMAKAEQVLPFRVKSLGSG